MGRSRIPDEAVDGVLACVKEKANPDPCIERVMEESGLTANDKQRVLTKALKKEVE